MRPFIASLTLLATLLHFTVGCCGHMHCVAGHACSSAADSAVGDDDHGHDHDHCHGHATEAGAVTTDGDMAVAFSCDHAPCPGHDCEGCTCAATNDARPLQVQAVDFFQVAWVAPRIELIPSAARAAWEAADPPVLSAITPPLCERLVV